MQPISYRDFYDVPRVFVVHHRGRLYLFDSPFNQADDEYASNYTIYELPGSSLPTNGISWAGLESMATRRLGTVPVERVVFDPTRRDSVDTSMIDILVDQVRV